MGIFSNLASFPIESVMYASFPLNDPLPEGKRPMQPFWAATRFINFIDLISIEVLAIGIGAKQKYNNLLKNFNRNK